MKILELFCGTKSFTKVCQERGHEVFTIDNDPIHKPDLCIDIMELKPEDIIKRFGNPDVIWASPPCTTFSVASIRHYWKDGKPKNDKTLYGIKLIEKTLELIKALDPKFFIIENPRGMMRKLDCMMFIKRDTVTYCKYGLEYQKATDLWNNLNIKFRPMCKANSPCHIRSPRGSKFGLQGAGVRVRLHPDWGYKINRKNGAAIQRAIVPKDLCIEIISNIEQNAK